MSSLSQFSAFFTGGGPFMFIILAIGMMILAMALERFWVIGRASAWNGTKLTKDLVERVRRGDVKGATEVTAQLHSPVGRVAHAILTASGRQEETLMNAADGEAAIALPPLARRLPALNLLGNTATLLGLLGTIFGLTTAFAAVGAADPTQRSAFLAAGISQALNTTAFGLIVAVPALMVHGYLSSRVERIVESVDEISVRLIRALVAGKTATASPATSTPATKPAAKATAAANAATPTAPTAARAHQPQRANR